MYVVLKDWKEVVVISIVNKNGCRIFKVDLIDINAVYAISDHQVQCGYMTAQIRAMVSVLLKDLNIVDGWLSEYLVEKFTKLWEVVK